MITRFRTIILILNLLVNIHLINSATFENVEIILTARQRVAGDIDLRDSNWIAPTRKIIIESDNNLGKYVKDETKLKVIDILNQKLPKLTTNSISDLPVTKELKIDSCGLKTIEPGTFQNIPKLSTLNLDNNQLEVIENGVFTGLDIVSLSLENNQISTIEGRAFNDMKLKYLYLQHNRLSKWNSDWFNGSPLYSIFISHNLLEEIPENAFEFLARIEKKRKFFLADFSSNRIRTIENGAFNHIGSFEDLNLNNNQLEQLQNGIFYGFKYLASLHIQNNKITNVDDGIFEDDARITSIDLINNQLSNFPLKLMKTNLHYLYIDNNPIRCDWIESVESWIANKTGDYFHQDFSPAIPRVDKLKQNCVN